MPRVQISGVGVRSVVEDLGRSVVSCRFGVSVAERAYSTNPAVNRDGLGPV